MLARYLGLKRTILQNRRIDLQGFEIVFYLTQVGCQRLATRDETNRCREARFDDCWGISRSSVQEVDWASLISGNFLDSLGVRGRPVGARDWVAEFFLTATHGLRTTLGILQKTRRLVAAMPNSRLPDALELDLSELAGLCDDNDRTINSWATHDERLPLPGVWECRINH